MIPASMQFNIMEIYQIFFDNMVVSKLQFFCAKHQSIFQVTEYEFELTWGEPRYFKI